MSEIPSIQSGAEGEELLLQGVSFQRTIRGTSLSGIVEKGDVIFFNPITLEEELFVGDVVFCRLDISNGRKGVVQEPRWFSHLIVGIEGAGPGAQYTIGNAHGWINGVASRENIFGLASHIRRGETELDIFELIPQDWEPPVAIN